MEIKVETILISSGHNYYGRYESGSMDYEIFEKESVDLIAGKGIVGDRFFNYKKDYKGQITFFSNSTITAVQRDLGYSHAQAQHFRRNVVLNGVNAESLIGKRFSIGALEFTGSCEAAPCFWMDEAVGEGTHAFLKGRGGLRARIIRGGTLTLGQHKLQVYENVPIDEKKKL